MIAVPVITSNGAELPESFELISVEVVREVNRIPFARLLFDDGDLPSATFPALDSADLAPGATLAIKVRLGDEITPLFEGLVQRLRLEHADGRPRLAVECKDKAARLTSPRRSAIYVENTDGDAVAAILRRNGLDLGTIDLEGAATPTLVQYEASDWDFIVSRAEAGGCVVVVADGELSVARLDLSVAAVRSLKLGIDGIEEFELELDAGGQHPDVSAVGWDLTASAASEPATAAPLALEQGDLKPDAVGRSLGLEEAELRHLTPASAAELKTWASARLAYNRLAMIRGRIALSGAGDIAPLDLIELNGFGARFDGKALIAGVRHSVDSSGWRTDLTLGLSPERFSETPNILGTPAQGLLPAARGLSLGVVVGHADDPDGEFRVKVKIPGVTGEETLWARLAAPEAGNERGFFFRPDPGDEVVVGFLAEDPRFPIVLGALFGSNNRPPSAFADLTEDNIPKGLVTRHGIEIALTDQDGKPILKLATPKGKLSIDDDKGEIALSDGNENSILLSKDGVTIKAGKDFKIEAVGKIVLKGASIDAN